MSAVFTGRDPDTVRAVAEAREPTDDYVLFSVAGATLALRASDVERVSAYVDPLPVPDAPAHFLGVVLTEGTVLAVLDPRPLLALPPSAEARKGRFIVCHANGYLLALAVDALHAMMTLPRSAHKPLVAEDVATRAVSSGYIETPSGPVHVIDGAQLVTRVLDVSSFETRSL